jgi:RNA polymerase sigma factor (sigma-70 family)
MSLAAQSNSELVARCRAGDEAAWRALVERFSRYVHAIIVGAYRLHPADAEDVFQEVFVRTYEHLERLRDDEAIRPWLGQLTRRACIDRLRAAAREAPGAEELSEVEEPVDELACIEEALDVHDALDQLSAECREVLDRFFCQDQPYERIGRELGIPPGTIASRISRCLTKLRERLA